MSHKYIANTPNDVKEMLQTIGVSSIDELFAEIPEHVRMNGEYNLDEAKSEIEVIKHLSNLSRNNCTTDNLTCFLGAGSYDHYIPSIVKHITGRSEFYTAYTPYQPEVSQGTLQYIFEWQSMITDLTDMPVTNASMYDGTTATAEAMFMACSATRRNKILVADSINTNIINVLKTYAHYRELELHTVNTKDGVLDMDDFKAKFNKDYAGIIVQNPNFNGIVEDFSEVAEILHEQKGLLIMNVNPMMLPLYKTPGEMNADIVAGEAQPFGLALNYGGAYLGFLASTNKLIRKMPGRICGQTTDIDGKRAWVLTLQAREQHIRREKANSNICSNQSLNALAATVYMSTLGQKGLKDVATRNLQGAHYAYEQITKLDAFDKVYDKPFFNEFVVQSKVPYEKVNELCLKNSILCGYHLGDDKILFAVTEQRTKSEIDTLVSVLGGLK